METMKTSWNSIMTLTRTSRDECCKAMLGQERHGSRWPDNMQPHNQPPAAQLRIQVPQQQQPPQIPQAAHQPVAQQSPAQAGTHQPVINREPLFRHTTKMTPRINSRPFNNEAQNRLLDERRTSVETISRTGMYNTVCTRTIRWWTRHQQVDRNKNNNGHKNWTWKRIQDWWQLEVIRSKTTRQAMDRINKLWGRSWLQVRIRHWQWGWNTTSTTSTRNESPTTTDKARKIRARIDTPTIQVYNGAQYAWRAKAEQTITQSKQASNRWYKWTSHTWKPLETNKYYQY